MPELPEVEVTRRTIAARLHGARITSVRCGKPLRWPLGCPPAGLVGSRLGEVIRRGKYLWLPLRRDAAQPPAGMDGGLLMHLGMSGSLALHDTASEPGPHAHFDLGTSRGLLRLTDPRRFGAVLWSPSLEEAPAAPLLARLGAEPFDPALTPQALHAACRRRKVAIKTLLLGGQVVVGAGNIYACEALFRAGIDPRTRCDRLSLPRCTRLLEALRETLGRALELGGSTLRDFSDAHGVAGEFQAEAGVYGREGQPCPRCGTAVRRIVQAQRSTFFCPACQRRA
ncbi:MAG: bifunctional DNA-formamidopyrimidine glycosylase/DNA-(apurinic or apyrimidinic site) lyase [Burkholderiaceae bacterium]|jgi:formamidopyrimidine-DNA glycosylase|nr:bifunctional DNA-formamidopyrimidine glycosylase/DNA-(apurinic or apyrimidinic site) lyase [Burkholderiaceae bacterium]MCU0963859.1 bifunctional DNA-formamidopyrimidine glycosylase/DNA-(apurinic or apyrimidinic site) lyase [Burkholderiaceae bacterium]